MSENNPNLHRNPNKRFSEIISEGFHLFGKNFTLILPLGLIFLISLVIKNLILVDLEWQLITITPAVEVILEGNPYDITNEQFTLLYRYLIVGFWSIFLDIIIPNIFNVIAICLVSNFVYKKFIGKETKLFSEVKRALNKKLLVVLLLLGVLFSVGWMMFIPGIIIFGFFIFYVFTYHSDDLEHPIKEARSLAKGEFWKIIGILVINNLFIMAWDTIFQYVLGFSSLQISVSWYNPSTRDYGLIILYDIILNFVQLLFTPLLICLLTPLYAHLKTRKEQFLQYQTPPSQEIPQYYDTSRQEILNGPAIYCPFCGKQMRVKFQFCMHCGEKLDFQIQE